MSKIEVNTIEPQSGTTVTVGASGDTITIPSGATLDASNATTTLPANVVTTDGTQTLTNKSIVATQLTGTITPSDGTVTTAKLADSSVSLAKLTATGTKDATTFLRGDNSFAEISSGLSVADQFRLTSDLSFGSTPTVFTANLERIDTAGQGTITTNQMSESNGNFTFPLTGIYLVTFIMFAQRSGDSRYVEAHINVTTDDSTYTRIAQGTDFIQQTDSSSTKCNPIAQTLIDVTDTSLVKVNFAGSAYSSTTAASSTTENRTNMTFLRLGDT